MENKSTWNWTVENACEQISSDLWQIDLGFQGRARVISAYLAAGSNELALIECGPSSSLANLERALTSAGFALQDVSKVLVTHIHLDHAGAAGVMASRNPELAVYAHPFGVPHMIDPARLVASAARIYQDNMEKLWGEVAPVPESQMVAYEDKTTLTVGDRQLEVVFTPGHAWHHVALFDGKSGDLFTGDVAGVRMPSSSYVCPPTPPPDLDPKAWAESVSAMQGLNSKRLCLTHFGTFDDPVEHLKSMGPNLNEFLDIGERDFFAGSDPSTLERHLHEQLMSNLASNDAEVLANYEWATPSYMAAMGLTRYLTKRDQ